MANPPARLKAGEIWHGMLTALRADFWTLFAIAAPFTLLVDMVLTLFGPPQPRTIAELTPQTVAIFALVPGIIGAVAQLAVAHLVARPGEPPRAALAAAGAALPAYVGALLLSALPTGVGFLVLIVPGLYLTARLFLSVPVAALERPGVVPTLRRSWELTAGNGWTILLFLVLAILFLLGASVLASGVGAALASVLALIGLKPVGVFVAALIPASLAAVFSIAGAAAATVIYLRLK